MAIGNDARIYNPGIGQFVARDTRCKYINCGPASSTLLLGPVIANGNRLISENLLELLVLREVDAAIFADRTDIKARCQQRSQDDCLKHQDGQATGEDSQGATGPALTITPRVKID